LKIKNKKSSIQKEKFNKSTINKVIRIGECLNFVFLINKGDKKVSHKCLLGTGYNAKE